MTLDDPLRPNMKNYANPAKINKTQGTTVNLH
eukprot:CAMPEP_0179906718 /NCGR_PEP_ID=MMETSP0982-20121206/43405_1 /TAXON_ID=483367 /ORGANISM="non described non described, Strain CCMP 2436" /LENGTH=31 /DNA_ID= /DNA_START= /DNA_END= /DNA_ORIENTATION=